MSGSLSTWTQRTEGPGPRPRTIYTGSTVPRPMYSSGKPTRTRGGAGGSREEHGRSQACSRQGTGALQLWEGGERPGRAPGFCQQLPEPRAGAEGPATAASTPAGLHCWWHLTRGRGGRGAALAQTRVSQFSADSENVDKIEGGSPAGSQPSRSSTDSVCSPQPPPALEIGPCPAQQLTCRPWSFPAALKTLSHCSRAVPATPPAASKS